MRECMSSTEHFCFHLSDCMDPGIFQWMKHDPCIKHSQHSLVHNGGCLSILLLKINLSLGGSVS